MHPLFEAMGDAQRRAMFAKLRAAGGKSLTKSAAVQQQLAMATKAMAAAPANRFRSPQDASLEKEMRSFFKKRTAADNAAAIAAAVANNKGMAYLRSLQSGKPKPRPLTFSDIDPTMGANAIRRAERRVAKYAGKPRLTAREKLMQMQGRIGG